MSDTDAETLIEKLIEKAAKAEKSDDAMRFSQAAVNSANALEHLYTMQRNKRVNARDDKDDLRDA